MKKKTKIVLDPGESAIVIDEEMNVVLYLPEFDEKDGEDPVPDSILLSTIITVLLKSDDQEFLDLIEKKSDELFENVRGE
jgi:hypothetical protein